MKRILDILKRLIATTLFPLAGRFGAGLLICVLISECSDGNLDSNEDQIKPPSPYVELRITMPPSNNPSSRANPMGGEEGNGREKGLDNEDRINDINIFFYIEESTTDTEGNAIGKGLDSADATAIIKHLYYNIKNPSDPLNDPLIAESVSQNEIDESYYPHFEGNDLVLKFSCSEQDIQQAETTGINFVIIANVGPLSDISKLGDLRNLKLDATNSPSWSQTYDAFSKNASKMDYFLMTTAYNENYTYNGLTTGNNKITKNGNNCIGFSTLQRMYARIDLWYNEKDNAVTDGNDNPKITELKYQVMNTDGSVVYVTNVLPINIMKNPSYLFKKVTDGLGSVWTKTTLQNISAFKWAGKESPSESPTEWTSDLPNNYVMEWHTTDKNPDGDTSDEELNQWYGKTTVKNVKEMIANDLSNSDNNIDNGKLSGYYHGEKTKGTYDPDYNCDHISIISYANENTHPTDCFHSNYLTGLAFRAVYVPAKIYNRYDPTTKSKIEMTETEKMEFAVDDKFIFRYSPSSEEGVKEEEAIYFSNYEALEAYRKDHLGDSALITQFIASREPKDGLLGFICYYNVWLRHYNDESADPQSSYAMEYATVRNNIYRVRMSFTGPGDFYPTMRVPDTMIARLYVLKWNFRPQPELIM